MSFVKEIKTKRAQISQIQCCMIDYLINKTAWSVEGNEAKPKKKLKLKQHPSTIPARVP